MAHGQGQGQLGMMYAMGQRPENAEKKRNRTTKVSGLRKAEPMRLPGFIIFTPSPHLESISDGAFNASMFLTKTITLKVMRLRAWLALRWIFWHPCKSCDAMHLWWVARTSSSLVSALQGACCTSKICAQGPKFGGLFESHWKLLRMLVWCIKLKPAIGHVLTCFDRTTETLGPLSSALAPAELNRVRLRCIVLRKLRCSQTSRSFLDYSLVVSHVLQLVLLA